MGFTTILQLILFVLCLAASALFSGSETALFSLSTLEREKLRRTSRGAAQRIIGMLSVKADDLLITILTGNMLVNMFATALYESLLRGRIAFAEETIAFLFPIVSMTLILLLSGELLPKSFAVRNPAAVVRFTGVPLSAACTLLSPLRFALSGIKRLASVKPRAAADERDLIHAAIQIGFKEGIIDRLEYNLFDSFFAFNQLTAEEIMLPRAHITGIEIDTPLRDILARCTEMSRDAAHSLLLVYRETIDHPLGYLELKDLAPFQFSVGGKRLTDLIHPCHSVPATKKVSQLLREMKAENTRLALAVDEYGGTAGLVTFQRIVECILASLYSSREEPVRAIGRNAYLLPGGLDRKSLEELFSLSLRSEALTAAGVVLERLGEIPEEGARVAIGGVQFTVVKMQKNRIQTLKAEVTG